MNNRKRAVRARTVLGAFVLVTAVGLMTYASALGEGTDGGAAGSVPGAGIADLPRAADPSAARRLLALKRTEGLDVVADTIRTVPPPGGAGPSWVIAPTRAGGVCVDTTRIGFCGTDRASIEAGRASATEYPPDKFLSRERHGTYNLVQTKPSDDPGVRRGVAPSRAVSVVALDRDGHVVRRAPVENGVYEIVVPPQGTRATVAFVDSAGATLARRPAEG